MVVIIIMMIMMMRFMFVIIIPCRLYNGSTKFITNIIADRSTDQCTHRPTFREGCLTRQLAYTSSCKFACFYGIIVIEYIEITPSSSNHANFMIR